GLALIGVLLALSDPAADTALLTQALLAGEMQIVILHAGLLLAIPERADTEAQTANISRQSLELENLATQISATADGMGRASSAIHLVTTQQSSGARQQAAVITQAIAMLSEFIVLAEQVRSQAREVADLFEQTVEASTRGQETIERAMQGMSQIRIQVTAIANNIASLAVQTRRIDEIITSVGEIATQSNLLALNASIEAARAGGHGRGFAVVADEVRTLAQQSQQAAGQVQVILGEIREAMMQTVQATQSGDQQVDEGMALSQQTGAVITQLAQAVEASTNALRSIVVAIEEQTVGLEQITKSMQNIQNVTQNNLDATRTAEIVAENLNRLSEELLDAIARQGISIEA
ncbi:MAG: hypothetical protein JW910_21535, partial [Anaerolineae bacterium]|nr:hypothetical protein [Anaerolineae bacterium]